MSTVIEMTDNVDKISLKIVFFYFISEEEDKKEVTSDGNSKEYAHITLTDLAYVQTLGSGGFGRVDLVSAYTFDQSVHFI